MRILHAISGIDPKNGGPTSALLGLADAQRRAGLEVRIIATWHFHEALDSAKHLEASGVGVRMVGPARSPLSRHPQLATSLIEEVKRSDVVHVHALWEDIQYQACRIARSNRTPLVVTPHGMLSRWSLSQHALRKRVYLSLRMRRHLDGASALHYTSAAQRDASAGLGLRPRAIIEPLGTELIDLDSLPPRGTFRAARGIAADTPVIAFLGRIHRGKGLEYLVPALAKLQTPGVILVVIGPDSEGFQRQIEREIERLNLRGRVMFTGMLTGHDKLAGLRDADLFSLPSEHENFGLSIIEALAVGTPAVISDQVNIHREVSAARVGGVVPLDVDALAAELDRWLGDANLRGSAAGAAPQFVQQMYNWDVIGRHWVEHYRQLATAPAAAVETRP